MDSVGLSSNLTLTQGDLSELLGVVNSHVCQHEKDEPPGLPPLSADAAHPYHIVVM